MRSKKSGFTLLEIIIVVIVIGILASIALPKMLRTVNYSYAAEALTTLGTIRHGMERCYLMNNNDYTNCTDFSDLNLEDPSFTGRFQYILNPQTASTYEVRANFDTDGDGKIDSAADDGSYITIDENGCKEATVSFASLDKSPCP